MNTAATDKSIKPEYNATNSYLFLYSSASMNFLILLFINSSISMNLSFFHLFAVATGRRVCVLTVNQSRCASKYLLYWSPKPDYQHQNYQNNGSAYQPGESLWTCIRTRIVICLILIEPGFYVQLLTRCIKYGRLFCHWLWCVAAGLYNYSIQWLDRANLL